MIVSLIFQKKNGLKIRYKIELDICKTPEAVGNPLCFRSQNLRVKLFPFSSAEFQKEDLLQRYQFSGSNVKFHIIQPNAWISMESFLYTTENSGLIFILVIVCLKCSPICN